MLILSVCVIMVEMIISYPQFEGQENLGKKKHEAFQSDGEVLEDKVRDAHRPDQVKEVEAVEVGLRKYEAGREKTSVGRLAVESSGAVGEDGRRMRCNRRTWRMKSKRK